MFAMFLSYNFQEHYKTTMEQIPQLKLTQKISEELKLSRLNDGENEQVNSHCKRDHLTPSPFDQRKNVSTYAATHSPYKNAANYNKPEVQKELQRFRKYENSTTALPNLPSILENSHYHAAFHGHSQEKLAKGKQGESWFLKMNWALDPKSNYQKHYGAKDGNNFNKQNKERVDHNHLTLFPGTSQNRNSNYKTQFQPYNIKKEAEIVIGNKDHLASRQNFKNDTAISEYQRRYDSLMEVAKPKDPLVSIYRKDTIIRQSKLKL